jgi:hypothetical protein
VEPILREYAPVRDAADTDVVDQLSDDALIGRWLRLSRSIRCENARTGDALTLDAGGCLCILSHVHADGKRIAFSLKATLLVQDVDLDGSVLIDGAPVTDW